MPVLLPCPANETPYVVKHLADEERCQHHETQGIASVQVDPDEEHGRQEP